VIADVGGAITVIGTSRLPSLLCTRIIVLPGALPTITTAATGCWPAMYAPAVPQPRRPRMFRGWNEIGYAFY